MSRRVQFRLVKALVILALAVGVLGLPSAEAAWPAPGTCGLYIGCEFCSCLQHGCFNGTEFPECGGNASCCESKVSFCWPGCTWY